MNAPLDYKQRLYENYYKTHILPRKGPTDLKKLRSGLKVFDRHFGEFLPEDKNATIIDAGCGSGNLVFWMQQRGFGNAGGFDSSPDQVAAGKDLGIANLEIGDIQSVLVTKRSACDMIFMRDVLEHIDKPFVMATLDQCYAALKPGGRLVLQVPNGASPVAGRVIYGDFTHEFAYTQTSLEQLFRIVGFNQMVFKPFDPYVPVVGWKSLFARSGWSAIGRWLAWRVAKSIHYFLVFAEVGPHQTISTFNLIAVGIKPHSGTSTV